MISRKLLFGHQVIPMLEGPGIDPSRTLEVFNSGFSDHLPVPPMGKIQGFNRALARGGLTSGV